MGMLFKLVKLSSKMLSKYYAHFEKYCNNLPFTNVVTFLVEIPQTFDGDN
jgi:hypothetical protein